MNFGTKLRSVFKLTNCQTFPQGKFHAGSKRAACYSTSITSDNHYQTLGISPSANKAEIKRKFYELSMIYHPDKNKDEASHKKFLSFNEAYSVLVDDEKRKDYDRSFMAHGRRGSSRNASFSNKHRARPTTIVKQYPDGVQFRAGFKFRGSDEPIFNFKEHQQKHYPESANRIRVDNTPFRFGKRLERDDRPKMAEGTQVLAKMAHIVGLIGGCYMITSIILRFEHKD
ncbi:hypothetical protein DSO57_1020057 [Entomophthora muscae]|uniref:Uncharacterized protein n=1 Tax=Entomophthora muscae TaxID=34485 RepID=A0ACC2RUV5_9FUNG|nr:hypothetical protein DSO57_1020057 [Entomophthora muscae]